MITQWVLLFVGLVLIAGTALYVAAEFSLVTADRATVSRQAAEGDRGARMLMAGFRSLSTQLSGAQVGITVTTLALGFVMEPSLASLLQGPLEWTGIPERVAGSISVTAALVIATVLSMVFGELVPKNIAIADPLDTAKTVVLPMRISTMLFRPLIWVLNGIANGVLRLIGIEPQEELRSARSSVELHSLVRRSAAQGTLEAPTAGLLARSIAFSGKSAADVLTPRVRVRFVKASDPADEILAAAVETGHSRFPVSGEDSDDVVGLVHLKRAVAIPPDERSGVQVRQLMVPVPVVPESIPLDDLLDQLRRRGLQMAVVADEYGGTAGILTLEDVVEELVGEIQDEHDPRVNRGERRADDTWLLPGTLRPDEIEEITGVSLPESGAYETVAGLLIAGLGRIPVPADTVTVPATMAAWSRLGATTQVPADEPVAGRSEDDLPRAVHVRLTVQRMVRRRVDAVVLSAVGLDDDRDPPDERTDQPRRDQIEGDRSGSRDGSDR
ncbi:hemolysin family protein [Nakamurella leprariae]|uniref:HlyC/CorC family transporter n=1 Tax=Nakamurella leprariae TaxID=2803911 RepID=A0A938YA36_9ACTN|nr:hemolysin family protein [Nakamurella leprariae]MBM9466772.1 HlyC/CorC family transporter [Nakamurella leprariae]